MEMFKDLSEAACGFSGTTFVLSENACEFIRSWRCSVRSCLWICQKLHVDWSDNLGGFGRSCIWICYMLYVDLSKAVSLLVRSCMQIGLNLNNDFIVCMWIYEKLHMVFHKCHIDLSEAAHRFLRSCLWICHKLQNVHVDFSKAKHRFVKERFSKSFMKIC